ncbi:GIDE domain-containing protein [Actinomadura fibrosa]|uniref:RING-type E3 ubiquitin transferase n=1 Tax=Actinomadura fibrosa TaxID=111802 RepID=A0ABW2Y1C1_9ACTN|nr:GIDE domain-containing protein [Actinomadura fibrosa]
MQYVIGIVAAGVLVVGWVWRMRYAAVRGAATVACAGLPRRAGERCGVDGTASAYGVRPAPFSGRPCVWYHVRATAKLRTGKRVFLDERSDAPLVVEDATGRLPVPPEGAFVDGAVRSFDERRTSNGDLPGLPSEDVVRYRYEEWILEPGRPLYVVGTTVESPHGITLGAADGQFMVSARGARALRRRALGFMAAGYGGGALLLVAAVAVAVMDAVSDDG